MALNPFIEQIWENQKMRISEHPDKIGILVLEYECAFCKEQNEIEVSRNRLIRWSVHNEFVQDVWPELTPEEREEITHCLHPKCSDSFYAEMMEGFDDDID